MIQSSNMEMFLLKSFRELKKKGLTQKSIGEMCGISQATISGVIRGKPCKLETFEVILNAIYEAKGWVEKPYKNGWTRLSKQEQVTKAMKPNWGVPTDRQLDLLLAPEPTQQIIVQEPITDKKTRGERLLSLITLGVC